MSSHCVISSDKIPSCSAVCVSLQMSRGLVAVLLVRCLFSALAQDPCDESGECAPCEPCFPGGEFADVLDCAPCKEACAACFMKSAPADEDEHGAEHAWGYSEKDGPNTWPATFAKYARNVNTHIVHTPQ